MGATYRRRGKRSWLVTVHSHGQREYKTVRSEQDAKALVQYIHKQELAGTNVIEAIQTARATVAPVAPTYPKLRDALPDWIDGQVQGGEFRLSTATVYRGRVASWVYPYTLPDGRLLGDVPVNAITREMLGAVIRKAKEAGRSRALLGCLRNPLKRYFADLIETKTLPGPNPAGDLRHYIGRHKKPKATTLAFFAQEEGPALIATAKALWPRWHAFILTGLLGGLRWGESAALFKSDIDWRRERIHVTRTVSSGRRLEACKDGEGRMVKASPALLDALREHIEKMDLEAQVARWTPEQRRLVFPSPQGKIVRYGRFHTQVWRPLLGKAGLPYRKYHATRHTFATWLLSDGADLRFVQQQLGHATIALTADTYGHLQPERHEAVVARLDQYVR